MAHKNPQKNKLAVVSSKLVSVNSSSDDDTNQTFLCSTTFICLTFGDTWQIKAKFLKEHPSTSFGTRFANSISNIKYMLPISTSSMVVEEKIVDQKEAIEIHNHEELSSDSESRDFNHTNIDLENEEEVSQHKNPNPNAFALINPQ